MPIEEEKKIITDFIQCYRHHPILWDISHIDYHHKRKREKAYAELTEIFRKVKPDASVDDAKRKINSLRTAYRREKRKQKRLRQLFGNTLDSQTNQDEPTLWWFDQLEFMDHILEIPKKESSTDLSALFPNLNQKHHDTESETEFQFSTKSNFVDVSMPSQSYTKQLNPLDGIKRELRSPLPDKEKRSLTTYDNEDSAHVYGRAWTIQFRNLNEDQKIFAKKAIDDILFEARLGTLHRHSIKINDSLCQHCQTAFLNTEYVEDLNDKTDFDDHSLN